MLTEQQSLFAETAARLAADHGGPKRLRALRAARAEIADVAWRAALAAEWLANVAAKARASGCALEIMRAALRMHGAIGHTEEHDIGLYYKRAVALAAGLAASSAIPAGSPS